MGCDPSQGYLTKEKKFISAQIGTTRNIFIYKGYKKWPSSFQIRLIRIDKF